MDPYFKPGIIDNSCLGSLCLYYGNLGSHLLERGSIFNVQSRMPCFVLYNSIEVQRFELHNSFQTSLVCVVNISIELLLLILLSQMPCFVLYNSIEDQHFELHNGHQMSLVCAVNDKNELLKLILLSQNMRMVYKCSPDWDDLCECLKSVILLTDCMRLTLKCSPHWDDCCECDNMCLILKCSPHWDDRSECENDALDFVVSLTDEMRSTSKCSSNWSDVFEYKKKVLKFVNLMAGNMCSTLKCSPEWDVICEYETDALNFVIPSSNYMCTTFICYPDWGEFRDDVHYENDVSNFIILMSLESCTYFTDWEVFFWVLYFENDVWKFVANYLQKWDESSYTDGNECKCLEPFSLWNNESMTIFWGKNQSKSCTFGDEIPLHSHQLTFLLLYFINLTMLKFNHRIYLFQCNLIKRCDALVYWLDQSLGYVFYFWYICFFGSETSIQRKIIQIENGNLTEMNDDFKCHFSAGGRHQTAVNGEIVFEYLQTCTDAKLLSDDRFFKGKLFEFIKYQPLSATWNDMSETADPIFFSKIPLDQLSTFLNVKELRDVSILHNISIPYNIHKKTMITYFRNHYCIQCEIYVSILVEKKT